MILKKFQINKDANHFLTLTKNQTIEANTILEKLVEFNHSNQANAYNKLEFSLRGDILDIYNSNKNPYRISFFDNVIETIKEFNPQTQLTFKDEKESIDILAKNLSRILTIKESKNQKGTSETVKIKDLIFASTGVIGEEFPVEKIRERLPDLVDKLRDEHNKMYWIKIA